MKKRNPAAVLLLPIVTLGIYILYWLYATRKELVTRNGRPNSIPWVLLLWLPLFIFIFLAFGVFMLSFANNTMSSGGNPPVVFAIITAVASIAAVLGILAIPLWWFWRFCHVLAEQTGADFTQLYVLFTVVGWLFGLMPVWMLIVQLDLNKLADHDAAGHHEHPHTGHPHPAHHNA